MLGFALGQTRVYQEAKQEGREEGRKEEDKSLILRQLTRQVGELPKALQSQIGTLPIPPTRSFR